MCQYVMGNYHLIFPNAIAAMSIAAEYGNSPPGAAEWTHNCGFEATPVMVCHVCRGSKSQRNVLFHRIVWQGLIVARGGQRGSRVLERLELIGLKRRPAHFSK